MLKTVLIVIALFLTAIVLAVAVVSCQLYSSMFFKLILDLYRPYLGYPEFSFVKVVIFTSLAQSFFVMYYRKSPQSKNKEEGYKELAAAFAVPPLAYMWSLILVYVLQTAGVQ